jgi:enoyl-CoA hydratase
VAFQNILVEQVEPGISRVTLNRPEKMNPFFRETAIELQEAFAHLNADATVRVVILTGSGKAFAGGADLNVLAGARSPWDGRAYLTLLYETFAVVERLAQPVIAAVNGLCIGAGPELVAACDFAIAAESARFAMPEVALGLPSVIQAALFPHYASLGRVREWLYTADEIDAREAERWGLVNRVVPDGALQDEALRTARKIASRDALAVRLQKELINRRWLRTDLETAMLDSIDMLGLAMSTGEPQRRAQEMLARLRSAKSRPRGDEPLTVDD